MTRPLTSIPTSGPTCISHLLQRCHFPPGHLTSNVCRKISTCSPIGMDFPVVLTHPKAGEPIVSIGKHSAVYPLGAPANSQKSVPSLRFGDCEMVVEEGQAWVVVGASGVGKDVLLQVCRNHSYCRQLVFIITSPLSLGATIFARSYKDPPVPTSARRPLSILDPPTHSAGPIQIRLPGFILAPTQISNRFPGLFCTVRCGARRRQTNLTRNSLSGASR